MFFNFPSLTYEFSILKKKERNEKKNEGKKREEKKRKRKNIGLGREAPRTEELSW